MSRIMLISEAGILDLHNSSLHTKAEFNNCYSASTRTEASGRRLSHHKGFFLKQKIPKFLCKRTNKIQGSTLQTGENIKTVGTYLTSQGAALKFMHVIAPFAKKKIGESSVFKKGCDWITFFRVPRFE